MTARERGTEIFRRRVLARLICRPGDNLQPNFPPLPVLLLLSVDFTKGTEQKSVGRFGRFLTLINSRPAERADRRKVEIKEGMEA